MRYALLAATTIATLSCASSMPTSSEAEIYAEILFDPEFISELGSTNRVLVVAELSDPSTLIQSAVSDFAELGADRAAIDALRAARANAGTVPEELWQHPKLQVERESDARLGRARQSSVSIAFRARFPEHKGFVRLSPIGFNASRTEAVATAMLECGGMCSHGNMFVLRQSLAGWRIVKRRIAWIS